MHFVQLILDLSLLQQCGSYTVKNVINSIIKDFEEHGCLCVICCNSKQNTLCLELQQDNNIDKKTKFNYLQTYCDQSQIKLLQTQETEYIPSEEELWLYPYNYLKLNYHTQDTALINNIIDNYTVQQEEQYLLKPIVRTDMCHHQLYSTQLETEEHEQFIDFLIQNPLTEFKSKKRKNKSTNQLPFIVDSTTIDLTTTLKKMPIPQTKYCYLIDCDTCKYKISVVPQTKQHTQLNKLFELSEISHDQTILNIFGFSFNITKFKDFILFKKFLIINATQNQILDVHEQNITTSTKTPTLTFTKKCCIKNKTKDQEDIQHLQLNKQCCGTMVNCDNSCIWLPYQLHHRQPQQIQPQTQLHTQHSLLHTHHTYQHTQTKIKDIILLLQKLMIYTVEVKTQQKIPLETLILSIGKQPIIENRDQLELHNKLNKTYQQLAINIILFAHKHDEKINTAHINHLLDQQLLHNTSTINDVITDLQQNLEEYLIHLMDAQQNKTYTEKLKNFWYEKNTCIFQCMVIINQIQCKNLKYSNKLYTCQEIISKINYCYHLYKKDQNIRYFVKTIILLSQILGYFDQQNQEELIETIKLNIPNDLNKYQLLEIIKQIEIDLVLLTKISEITTLINTNQHIIEALSNITQKQAYINKLINKHVFNSIQETKDLEQRLKIEHNFKCLSNAEILSNTTEITSNNVQSFCNVYTKLQTSKSICPITQLEKIYKIQKKLESTKETTEETELKQIHSYQLKEFEQIIINQLQNFIENIIKIALTDQYLNNLIISTLKNIEKNNQYDCLEEINKLFNNPYILTISLFSGIKSQIIVKYMLLILCQNNTYITKKIINIFDIYNENQYTICTNKISESQIQKSKKFLEFMYKTSEASILYCVLRQNKINEQEFSQYKKLMIIPNFNQTSFALESMYYEHFEIIAETIQLLLPNFSDELNKLQELQTYEPITYSENTSLKQTEKIYQKYTNLLQNISLLTKHITVFKSKIQEHSEKQCNSEKRNDLQNFTQQIKTINNAIKIICFCPQFARQKELEITTYIIKLNFQHIINIIINISNKYDTQFLIEHINKQEFNTCLKQEIIKLINIIHNINTTLKLSELILQAITKNFILQLKEIQNQEFQSYLENQLSTDNTEKELEKIYIENEKLIILINQLKIQLQKFQKENEFLKINKNSDQSSDEELDMILYNNIQIKKIIDQIKKLELEILKLEIQKKIKTNENLLFLIKKRKLLYEKFILEQTKHNEILQLISETITTIQECSIQNKRIEDKNHLSHQKIKFSKLKFELDELQTIILKLKTQILEIENKYFKIQFITESGQIKDEQQSKQMTYQTYIQTKIQQEEEHCKHETTLRKAIHDDLKQHLKKLLQENEQINEIMNNIHKSKQTLSLTQIKKFQKQIKQIQQKSSYIFELEEIQDCYYNVQEQIQKCTNPNILSLESYISNPTTKSQTLEKMKLNIKTIHEIQKHNYSVLRRNLIVLASQNSQTRQKSTVLMQVLLHHLCSICERLIYIDTNCIECTYIITKKEKEIISLIQNQISKTTIEKLLFLILDIQIQTNNELTETIKDVANYYENNLTHQFQHIKFHNLQEHLNLLYTILKTETTIKKQQNKIQILLLKAKEETKNTQTKTTSTSMQTSELMSQKFQVLSLTDSKSQSLTSITPCTSLSKSSLSSLSSSLLSLLPTNSEPTNSETHDASETSVTQTRTIIDQISVPTTSTANIIPITTITTTIPSTINSTSTNTQTTNTTSVIPTTTMTTLIPSVIPELKSNISSSASRSSLTSISSLTSTLNMETPISTKSHNNKQNICFNNLKLPQAYDADQSDINDQSSSLYDSDSETESNTSDESDDYLNDDLYTSNIFLKQNTN